MGIFRIRLVFYISWLFPLVLGESLKGTAEQIIIYSCQSALSQYKFGCEDLPWKCTCEYQPILGSMLHCMNTYLPSSGNTERSRKLLIENCDKNGHVNTLTEDLIRHAFNNASNFIIKPNDSNFNRDEIQHLPILPLQKDVMPKFRDYQAFLGNFDLAQRYGLLINVYWIGVLSVFAFFNQYIKKRPHLNNVLKGKTINRIRSTFSLPLLFGSHFRPFIYLPSSSPTSRNFTSLLPTSLEGLILFIYFFLNTIFLVSGFQVYQDNSIFGSNLLYQTSRYVADRSGVLAFAHFPLLILFAGRNNLLISFSGLPYSSFMIFHKWTARVMVINSVIHSLAYAGIMTAQKRLRFFFITRFWFQAGVIATLLAVMVVMFAIHNIRVKYYEFFLITHIVLAFWFFITCYYHCVEFGWLEWIKAAFFLWAADRVIRICKLVKFGAPMAKIDFIADQTFKVSVQRPHNWKPYPGCFVFIHFLHPSVFWQSHPFTIVDSILSDEEVTIYIKAKEGFTKKLMEILNESSINRIHLRVSLEGPYGSESPADKFDNVLLIAGGNGIPGPFYHAVHLLNHSLIPKQRVRLIWTIRQVESLKWFQEELKVLQESPNIEFDIYITSQDFNANNCPNLPIVDQFRGAIRFHSGRPPMSKLLLDEFQNSTGSIAVITCGPPVMCDEIRDFVSNNLDQCSSRVDLFEELQVW